jgi:hypothetical protein
MTGLRVKGKPKVISNFSLPVYPPFQIWNISFFNFQMATNLKIAPAPTIA